MSGNFLSCSKGVKDPFEVQEGSCDFSRDATAEKGVISPGGNPKGNQPEYSLEGLMLKLKLQYFGYLRRRADSLERTLVPGKIEGRRRG